MRVQERTALCNQVRGLVAEYGLVLAQGVGTVRRHLPELVEAGSSGLRELFRTLLRECAEQLRERATHIEVYTRVLATHAGGREAVRRLQTVPGFDPVVANVRATRLGRQR